MEIMRRTIRSVLGYDSRFYKAGAAVIDFLSTAKKEGIKTWYELNGFKRKMRKGESSHSVVLSNLKHPILVRPGTSDAGTIINNIVREEYGHFSPCKEPLWMIDAGAYIGDTSAFYLSKFPKIKVIALEPNPESYEMAKRNLCPYGERAILLNKGLFSNEQTLCFSGSETGASITTSGFEIECTTIPSLLEFYSIPYIDILKMDIEGAEEAIFSSEPEVWLDQIGLLIIECHGSHIEELIRRVLVKNGFSTKRYRSLWYFWKTRE